MWEQRYTPLGDSLALSTFVASLPILVVLAMLGIYRRPAWQAASSALVVAVLVALFAYGMPVSLIGASALYGAAFALFPISWIIFWALVIYRITVDTGCFEVIKDSVGSLTTDARLQALLVGFAFGAFLEGAAGFGTPVAVAASMLTGLGFTPFFAAGVCLLANTAPVAFGSIGIPLVTLAGITGLPLMALSADVGRLCAPVSLFIPAYLLAVVSGWKGLRGVLPAAAVCGIAFAGTQYFVSTQMGPYLTDIASSLAAIVALYLLLKVWKPADTFRLGDTAPPLPRQHATATILRAWLPYLLLVAFICLWGYPPVRAALESTTASLAWPGLHNVITRMPPVAAQPTPYAALFKLDLLAASGTACLVSAVVSALLLGLPVTRLCGIIGEVLLQLRKPALTIASVLALAFLLNYSGATATLGLAFAATGAAFPVFSALLGWLGVFLTGSDTSANALFGNLQVVTARHLDLDPTLMAASNSSGGVMGKMISLQSIAVAAAATGMPASDESRLFRFTLKHSVFLAAVVGLLTLLYSSMR